jgi:hypothetical protein
LVDTLLVVVNCRDLLASERESNACSKRFIAAKLAILGDKNLIFKIKGLKDC